MNVEQKALELVNAERLESGLRPPFNIEEARCSAGFKALVRAIEAHEADKQRFSEAAAKVVSAFGMYGHAESNIGVILSPFILPQPDPLAECFAEIGWSTESPRGYRPDRLRAALETRGLAIVAKREGSEMDNSQEPIWAILDGYRYTPVRVVKETKSTLFYVDGYGRERKSLSAMNWRGTEVDARKISLKLQSANAEMNRRKRAASDWFKHQVATLLNERPNHEG